MKLYNTLSRKVEGFQPQYAPRVSVYTCGPTVYDYAHVGHWFTYVRWDILVRALQLSDFKPDWVMNITDVGHLVSDADEGEDKLEKGARREGKTAWEVADYYTKDFLWALETLNIQKPKFITKATEHIAEQIALVQKLEDKGYAYVISDGVYYDTSKFAGYAAFARLDLDDQQEGARVATNSEKRNPSDFALWKFSPKDQTRDMEWDSPWGKGFPGWHIECSAMSMRYLGDTIDIHTGGIDHIPVHHTNEIAQSEAASGKRFANYWMHSNHVSVNGEKISKSLGNGIRLQEILDKGISATALRLHILESHYRSQSKFSWESLEAAENRLARWREVVALRWQVLQPNDFLVPFPATTLELQQAEAEHIHTKTAAAALAGFKQALLNDLDTPRALAEIESIMNVIEREGMTSFALGDFTKLLQQIHWSLGIDLFDEDISQEQKDLIAEREAARAAKDWATADTLRDSLLAQGIGLRDSSMRITWYRTK